VKMSSEDKKMESLQERLAKMSFPSPEEQAQYFLQLLGEQEQQKDNELKEKLAEKDKEIISWKTKYQGEKFDEIPPTEEDLKNYADFQNALNNCVELLESYLENDIKRADCGEIDHYLAADYSMETGKGKKSAARSKASDLQKLIEKVVKSLNQGLDLLYEIAILNYESRNIIAKEIWNGNDPNQTEVVLDKAEVEVEKKAKAKAGWAKNSKNKNKNANKRKKARR